MITVTDAAENRLYLGCLVMNVLPAVIALGRLIAGGGSL